MAETPADRAAKLGVIAAPVQPVSVPSVPVSTNSKEIPMSTNNTNTAATVPANTSAPAAPTMDMQTMFAAFAQFMASQAAGVAQTQPQPTTSAPTLATETPKPPEKKPFELGRPAKPYIPEKIEVYAPCKKDDAGKLTEQPNGTLCFFLGTNSKISLGWDEWQIVLEQFESGLVREMMAECAKTGQKQQWKL